MTAGVVLLAFSKNPNRSTVKHDFNPLSTSSLSIPIRVHSRGELNLETLNVGKGHRRREVR